MAILSLVLCALLLDPVPARALTRHPRPIVARVPAPDTQVTSPNGTLLPPYTTVYYFDQLVDHDDPGQGTFRQRYWHTAEFYEPGGPIIAYTPGEDNGEGYEGFLTNQTLNGLLAQQQNGAVVLLEHRFYGLSNPHPDLTVASLRVHTVQQAIEDWVYFARNVVLPMPGGDRVGPEHAPWVMVGGSYSGALTSWTMVEKPGVFWAGHASSAVVETTIDFWRYFEPIRENMPQNCSADVAAVIAHVDLVLTGGNATAIDALKAGFGMAELTHLDDVAGALRYNLWDWQLMKVATGPGAQFYRFCDALEVRDGTSAPPAGWGLEHALAAWGAYWTGGYLDHVCAGDGVVDCLGSYDAQSSFYTNTTIDNADRSWFWIVCNEVGFLQDGPPTGVPALVSRLVQPAYDEHECAMMFPAAFSTPPVPRVAKTNARYHGWDVQVDRLFFANGKRDPWRYATVSAEGLGKTSMAMQPIALSDGFHASDLRANASVDASVAAVQQQALAAMRGWLAEWKAPGPG